MSTAAISPVSPPLATLPKAGFVRLPAVLALIPISKSLLWEMIGRGEFPRPVKLSARVTAWRNEDVLAFIASRHA